MTGAGASRTVRVSVGGHQAELAADALWQAGAVAIEERPGALVAAAGDGDPATLVAAVAGRWPVAVEAVDGEGARARWRAFARPVVVGRRLVVRQPWGAPPAAATGRREVVIDPGHAFGHGAHPSTRLALAALDDLVHGGERVLDLGCGSGVLAVAALVLGAGRATAVDVDPAALAVTRDNAARNGVAARLAVVAGAGGRAGGAPAGAHDVVVANLLLPEVVAMAPAVRGALAPGATAVVSGVLIAQRAAAAGACRAAGLVPQASATDDGWLALRLQAA